MKRDTAIERVTNALRAEGGRASTRRLCEILPGMDKGLVLMALAHLKRRDLVDSDYAPRRQPPCGWTYWFSPAKKVHRGSRFKAAVSNGYTRLIVEYLDSVGGEATVEAWLSWGAQITHRVRLHSGVHSLRRRGLIELGKTHVRLTARGRQALALGRTVAPIAPTISDFEDVAEPETRSTDPEACVARAEKLWPKLMRGRRYEDIPAHLIRPQRLLRWTPPLVERSMVGSSGAMLAESRSAEGGEAMRTWRGVILGEPASKANSRRIVRTGSHVRVIKSEKALAYVEAVARQVPELPPQEQLLAPIRMTAHLYYASRRPDLDPSLILDALQGRVYRNDRAVREMHLHHHLDRNNPRAEILLEEMTDDE